MNGTATIEKHPRGLYILFGTEMWERFSFYTVNAMLVLYLRDNVQGFNFSNAQASGVSSWYQAFVYFTPLFGGLLADLFLGFRKAIVIGGLFFIAGHALLAVPNSLMIVYAALACLVLGNGLFKPNVSSMVGNLYQEGSHLKDKAYLIFYMGINVGAFTAPLLANYIQPRWGFHPAFFMGAIGMIISVTVFLLNQKYVRHADRIRGKKIESKAAAVTEDLPPMREEARLVDAVPEWKRILALIVIFLIVIVFWMVFHQNSISLTFWANDHSYKLPGILSNAINPLYIILLSLPLAAFWSWLDKKGMEPSTPVKMTIGMLLTGLSFVILYISASMGGFTKPVFKVVKSTPAETWVTIAPEARAHLGITAPGTAIDEKTEGWLVTGAPGAKEKEYVRLESFSGNTINVVPVQRVSRWWLIFAYGVLSLGELMLSPMGLSLVSKVAPIRMRGLMMGGWFAATAIGNKLTGVAKYWDLWSHANFFIILASMALFMAVVLFALLRPLKRAMPGV
jgi:POT family proton-dependent oligopeptide transporter